MTNDELTASITKLIWDMNEMANIYKKLARESKQGSHRRETLEQLTDDCEGFVKEIKWTQSFWNAFNE